MRRAVVRGIVIAGVVLCPRAAGAADNGVELTWDAPAGCPTEAQVRPEIEDALGGAKFAHWVRARARVMQDAHSAWTADLLTEVDGVARRRLLRAPSCAELAAAVATVLALGGSGELVDAAPKGKAAPPPPPKAPPKPDAPTQFAVGANGAAWTGAVVGAGSLGFGGQISWVPSWGRVELGALYFPPVEPQPGYASRYIALMGTAKGCYSLFVGSPLSLSPCIGFEVGYLRSMAPGDSWIAPKAGGLVAWQFGNFALRSEIDVVVPTSKPGHYRIATVSARALLGLEVRFP